MNTKIIRTTNLSHGRPWKKLKSLSSFVRWMMVFLEKEWDIVGDIKSYVTINEKHSLFRFKIYGFTLIYHDSIRHQVKKINFTIKKNYFLRIV